ncbi:hypothetical protein ACH5RR_030336 [Cinchona calisaya]|uniref:F-box domain-containing protein n=1 Tax=Cinchona calisaya TaxID=153742 RepID=A0ABD2YUA8_9GENT
MIGESSNRIAMEEGAEDRISNFPQNVIDHILDCLPIRDAARTSSLSSKWRHYWAEYPNLVLDDQFTEEIKQKRNLLRFEVDYVNIVSGILLQHQGAITKFVLHFPEMILYLFDLNSNTDEWNIYSNINNWMMFLSRKGLRELTLQNSNPDPYRIPLYLFSCLKLTYMSISRCIFRAPVSSRGFANLTTLVLSEVTFESSVLIIPQLHVLNLRNCSGIRLLNISTPLLRRLTLLDNDDFELRSYMNCKSLVHAYIGVSNKVELGRQDESVSLTTILGCWPKISALYLDGSTLDRLTAGTVPESLPSRIMHLKYLALFRISYHPNEIACILCLLRSSPNLSRLEIWTHRTINSSMETVEFLEEPGVMGQKMYRLKTVMMKHYMGSAAELVFVKLLLTSSPSLERICVEWRKNLAPSERLKADELIQFARASSKAQVIFKPI